MIESTQKQYLILVAMSKFGISFIAAMYVTFLLSKGLNLFEVNLVNLVFFTTMFVCEIPTGAFADVFGRKTSYVMSCGLLGLGMLLYFVSSSFWGFALAECVSAIGATFASGAFQAWVVDTLKHHGYTGTLTKLFAREQQVSQGMGILGGLSGALIADVSIALPWLIAAGITFATGVVAFLWMKEDYFVRQKLSFKAGLMSMKDVTQTSIQYGVRNKAIRFILVIGTVQFIALQAPNMQWQPFFSQFFTGEISSFGIMWVGMSLSLMLGAWLAPRFLQMVPDEKRSLVLVQAMVGIGIALSSMWKVFPVAITIFLLHEVARGMFKPLKDVYLHDNIPSKERATIVSFESIAHHGGGMIGLLGSGLLAQYAGIPLTWAISGLLLLTSTLLVVRNGSRKK